MYIHLDVADAVLEAVLADQPLLVPDKVLHLLYLHPELLHISSVTGMLEIKIQKIGS
jgi:hypothetical protein